MFEKLESVEKRYEELTTKISDPSVIADNNEWRKLVKEHSSIEDVVTKYREYKQTIKNMKEAEEMMNDSELKELAEEEYYSSKERLASIEEELETAPKDVRFEFYVKAWYLKGRLGVEESFGWTHLVNADWDDFKKTLELIVDDLEKGKTPEPLFAK